MPCRQLGAAPAQPPAGPGWLHGTRTAFRFSASRREIWFSEKPMRELYFNFIMSLSSNYFKAVRTQQRAGAPLKGVPTHTLALAGVRPNTALAEHMLY